MSRNWAHVGLLAFVGFLFVACGGGGDDGAASFSSDESDGAAASFSSEDGVVTVSVPEGAAPDGFTGTVSVSDPAAVGIDISDADSVLLAYRLGPDGTEFDEPVSVTFRIPADLGDFDPSEGLPISLVLVEDGTDGYELLGSVTSSLDGDTLVVEGTPTHFSEVVIYLYGRVSITIDVDPDGEIKPVDSQFKAEVVETSDENDYYETGRVDYSFTGSVSEVSTQEGVATVLCANEGLGVVEASVYGGDLTDFSGAPLVIAGLFTNWSAQYIGKLHVDIECVEGPSGGRTIPATKINKFTVEQGSYIFTVEVDGNGRELATAENTQWYAPRFIVTTSSGSFAVTAK